jgi:hypothetical protein
MSRLIDADALMQTLGITDMDCVRCAWYSKAYRRCKRGGYFEDACRAIEDAPTIEAVPERKKGRWLRYNALGEPDTGDTFYWQCDKCLKTEKGYMTAWAYCPNCGASMTEGAEE